MTSDAPRFFVGGCEDQRLPYMVLRSSILGRCPQADVRFLCDYEVDGETPRPRKKSDRPRTQFSFQRFLIPKLCGYQGRAVYLDSDMLVFGDPLDLWQHDFRGGVASPPEDSRGAQFAVMLIDCERARWDIVDLIARMDANKLDYRGLMDMRFERVSASLSQKWNCLDWMDDSTKLLHFTDMTKQPWVRKCHPLRGVWESALEEAMRRDDTGKVVECFVGGLGTALRPSLSSLLGAEASDYGFVPPYMRWRRK